MKEWGYIHIYCGHGKGKTTAAIGLVIRASSYCIPIIFMQFMKNGSSGEIEVLSKIPTVQTVADRSLKTSIFSLSADEKEAHRKWCDESFGKIISSFDPTQRYLIVFDEIFGAIRRGFFSEKFLLKFLQEKSDQIEVVLTGRGPSMEINELADYISEIKKIKHPFTQGVVGRLGIER